MRHGVLFALFHHSRKPYHSLKISILLQRPTRLKPNKFLKFLPELGPKRPSPIDNGIHPLKRDGASFHSSNESVVA